MFAVRYIANAETDTWRGHGKKRVFFIFKLIFLQHIISVWLILAAARCQKQSERGYRWKLWVGLFSPVPQKSEKTGTLFRYASVFLLTKYSVNGWFYSVNSKDVEEMQ